MNAAYVEIDPERVSPYIESESYRRFTSEFLPHVAFTPYLGRLADELVAGESNPYLKAWRIYDWITGNVSYALVPEYSTIECISDYAARNLRGDCGVQALLFITLCRISGVPAGGSQDGILIPLDRVHATGSSSTLSPTAGCTQTRLSAAIGGRLKSTAGSTSGTSITTGLWRTRISRLTLLLLKSILGQILLTINAGKWGGKGETCTTISGLTS